MTLHSSRGLDPSPQSQSHPLLEVWEHRYPEDPKPWGQSWSGGHGHTADLSLIKGDTAQEGADSAKEDASCGDPLGVMFTDGVSVLGTWQGPEITC